MSWWEQFGLTSRMDIQDSQLEEVREVFTDDGHLLSYYPVTMSAFVGTETFPQILKLAIVMSRTMKVDNLERSHNYFLKLKPSEWNKYMEHLDI